MKGAGEILTNEIDTAVEGIKSCVTPIFDVNDKGEAELLGSAVLIEVSGDVFLCTAKHVIDKNANSTLYVDGTAKMEVLEGDFYGTQGLDVAVLTLLSEQIKTLSKYTPLQSDLIAGSSEFLAAQYVAMVGSPETKNRKVYRQNKIKGLIYSAGGMVIESTLPKVRVSFDRKRMIDAKTRKRVHAPDPHGMSGGAMFGVRVNNATIMGRPKPKLIAIMTDHPLGSKEIFGPSTAIVMAIIRDVWGVSIPAQLQAPNVRTKPFVMRKAPAQPASQWRAALMLATVGDDRSGSSRAFPSVVVSLPIFRANS